MAGSDRLAALAAADSARPVSMQVSFRAFKRSGDLVRAAAAHKVQVEGFSHAFRYGSDVQVGEFNLDEPATAAEAERQYRESTLSFLTSALAEAENAASGESNPRLKGAHRRMAAAFRTRLNRFRSAGSLVHTVRLHGEARRLLALRGRLRDVRHAGLPDAVTGEFDENAGDIGLMFMEPVCSPTALIPEPGCEEPCPDCYVEPEPDPTPDGGTDPYVEEDPWAGFPPPSYSIAPGDASYYDYSHPVNDQSTQDDNRVNNRSWTPSNGLSMVDTDNLGRYTYQKIYFADGRLARYKNSPGSFTYEHETHQDGRDGQRFYGEGYEVDRNGSKRRGYTWESNFPYAYLDEQVGSDAFDKVRNHTIGSTRPDRFSYRTWYYGWIRYNRSTSIGSREQIQISSQLGNRVWGCDSSAYCTVSKVTTVRPLPFMCSYQAPNNGNVVYTRTNGYWKGWSWDGYGYKNEQCK
ncbi:MAG TPA: hypothetical protein VF613_15340 [Longimicrobium sp.]|jgi:hypothetical protein